MRICGYVDVDLVVVRRAGSGDHSLLSSNRGRPKQRWRRRGWTVLGQKAFCRRERASGVNGGQVVDVYVYVRKAKGVRVEEGRFAWLAGGLGLSTTSRASTR